MSRRILIVADDRRTSLQAAAIPAAGSPSDLLTLLLAAGDAGPSGGTAGAEPWRRIDLTGGEPVPVLAAAAGSLSGVLDEARPAAVVTMGDSPASLGAALATIAAEVPLLRLGAGRRSHRRRGLGAETSRVLQDHLAARCFACSGPDRRTLLREGMAPGRVRLVREPAEDAAGGALLRQELDRFLAAPERVEWHPLGALPPAAAPSGLTLDAYRDLIRSLREAGYSFTFYPEALAAPEAGPVVLLRHDVDLSVDEALRMAELEAELGVGATYFFLLRSDHYNPLSSATTSRIRRILGLGHRLGLHLDLAAYGDDAQPSHVRQACAREAALLADWVGHQVDAVSFHRPPMLAMAGDPSLTAPLPHTSLPRFQRDMKYLSESRGAWREGPPTEHQAFRERRSLQILVHPVWWREEPCSPLETLLEVAGRMRESLELSIARNNTVYRLGWLAEAIGDVR